MKGHEDHKSTGKADADAGSTTVVPHHHREWKKGFMNIMPKE